MKLKLLLKMLLIDIIFEMNLTTNQMAMKEPCFRGVCKHSTRPLFSRILKRRGYSWFNETKFNTENAFN